MRDMWIFSYSMWTFRTYSSDQNMPNPPPRSKYGFALVPGMLVQIVYQSCQTMELSNKLPNPHVTQT